MPESTVTKTIEPTGGISRYHLMPKPIKLWFIISTMIAMALFIIHFKGIPIFGYVLSGTFYYYLLYTVMVFNVFMGLPATQIQKRRAPPWYDYVMASVLLACVVFFLINSEPISLRMWEPPPNFIAFAAAVIVLGLGLEAGRRIGGWGYLTLLGISIVYPMFADKLPGVLAGYPITFSELVGDFAYGANGMLGLPAAMFGSLILGFYLFAGVISGLGAADFFLKLATSILGRFRGGPAKVSVLSSALFGTLSGSIIANIVGTGTYTIPAMKRMGFSPERAAAVEACSSCGGPIMPPIMGGLAFLAAIIGGYEYTTIMIAAVIPAVLYFTCLLMQIDAHAAKIGMRGLPKEEVPPVLPVLRDGWIYIVAILFLIVGLIYFRWGAITPIYAAFLMFLLTFTSRRTRMSWAKIEKALSQTASLINFGVGIFLSMSLILVGLFKTGVAAAITAWVVGLGANNLYLILAIAAVFNIMMGMVGLDTSAFIFLSVTMAPAVAAIGGVPLVACHLFLICYSVLGDVTPPVAVGAFIAASIGGANPMKTAWIAFRQAIVLFFMPFFFVLQPALVMQGTPGDIIYHLFIALLGILVLASAIEGYMVRIGRLSWWQRAVIGTGGFLIALPELRTTLIGFGMAAVVIAITELMKRAAVVRTAT